MGEQTVYDEIKAERAHQDAKWGGPDHDDQHVCSEWEALVRQRFISVRSARLHDQRHLLVEAAALCVAALESWDRNMKLQESLKP